MAAEDEEKGGRKERGIALNRGPGGSRGTHAPGPGMPGMPGKLSVARRYINHDSLTSDKFVCFVANDGEQSRAEFRRFTIHGLRFQ